MNLTFKARFHRTNFVVATAWNSVSGFVELLTAGDAGFQNFGVVRLCLARDWPAELPIVVIAIMHLPCKHPATDRLTPHEGHEKTFATIARALRVSIQPRTESIKILGRTLMPTINADDGCRYHVEIEDREARRS